jgi:hypothetical protein
MRQAQDHQRSRKQDHLEARVTDFCRRRNRPRARCVPRVRLDLATGPSGGHKLRR